MSRSSKAFGATRGASRTGTVANLAGVTLTSCLLVSTACAREPEAPAPPTRDGVPPGVAEVGAPPDAAPGAFAPHLSTARGGLLLSWLEPTEEGHRLRFARFEGGSWSPAETIAAGDDFFANWADVPSVVEGADGGLLAHWLTKTGEATYAYGIELARSRDGGKTWEPLGALQDDASLTEHGFVSLLPAADAEGGFQAVWLDGRRTADEGPMSLRGTWVTDRPSPSVELDDRVCDCCPTAAVAAGDGVLVAYRNRSDEEVRDIFVTRWGPEGWSPPREVHHDGWVFPACPVNGPALAADGEKVVLAWFTAADGVPRVQAAFSDDGGATFGSPVEIDREGALGRVGVASFAAGEEAVVAWLATEEKRGAVYLRRVARDGRRGEPLRFAATDSSRSSGIPRSLARGDVLYLAWVEAGETGSGEPSRLRFRGIPLDALAPPDESAAGSRE